MRRSAVNQFLFFGSLPEVSRGRELRTAVVDVRDVPPRCPETQCPMKSTRRVDGPGRRRQP